MKNIVLPFALALSLSPALAEQTTPTSPSQDGFSLMEEGAKLLFRGLMAEVEPSLDDMGHALSQIEPALRELEPVMRELLAMVDDLRNYDAPVMLDNGDILIRRKLPQPNTLNPEFEL